MEAAAALGFAAVGALHIAPGLAFFAPGLLKRLYGDGAEGAVGLMLQHRAALLGVVGVLCLVAALVPPWRAAAVTAGALSMTAYLALWAGASGEPRAALRRIAIADMCALPILLAAAWAGSVTPT